MKNMSKVIFELDTEGVKELLKSEALATECRRYAQGIAARAGEGFVCEDRHYPERTGCAVRPDTDEAYYQNLNDNTLLKALK